MAEPAPRRYRWYVEQYDPDTKTLYVRIELEGVWVATIPVKEVDVRGKGKDKAVKAIDGAVRRALSQLRTAPAPTPPQVPDEYRLEGEGEV